MKKIIIFCCLLLSLISVKAQDIVFYQGDTPLPNNAEITVSKLTADEITGDFTLETDIKVKNLSSNAIEATMSQTVITAPSSGEISFCFFTCYNDNKDKSQIATLPANSFFSGLHLYFYITEVGKYTTAQVKYQIFNNQSPKNMVTLTINYIYNENSTGIQKPVLENTIDVYQSGKNTVFRFSPELEYHSLAIYTLSGQQVATYLLPSKGVFTLPKELGKGIYIYFAKGNKGLRSAQKFIVL
jgi:hypothetical protein